MYSVYVLYMRKVGAHLWFPFLHDVRVYCKSMALDRMGMGGGGKSWQYVGILTGKEALHPEIYSHRPHPPHHTAL